MPVNVNEIIRKLSPAERKKVQARAAAIIAEEMGSPPEVLRVIGAESKRKGTASLSSRQIDRIIKKARTQKKAGRKSSGVSPSSGLSCSSNAKAWKLVEQKPAP
jgi:hypothetical protein